jgi:GT2 family glycosyltransferase
MKLSIIIVNYQSYKHLLTCLKSIDKFLYKNSTFKNDFEVILVNNDKTTLSLSPKYPFVNEKIINTGKNVGFGTANNLGTIMTQGDYLMFLNPDTILTDCSLLQAVDYLKNHDDVGVLGLGVIDNNRKSPQNWSCVKKITWGNILFRNTINKPWNKKTPQKVDWTTGTALMVKKSLFRKINGFDKNFFMYFEDQDLCLRIKNLKSKPKIIHYPESMLLHFNGKSWKNKRKQKIAYQNSQLYFFKKHNTFVGYFILKTVYKIKNLF